MAAPLGSDCSNLTDALAILSAAFDVEQERLRPSGPVIPPRYVATLDTSIAMVAETMRKLQEFSNQLVQIRAAATLRTELAKRADETLLTAHFISGLSAVPWIVNKELVDTLSKTYEQLRSTDAERREIERLKSLIPSTEGF